MPLHTENHAIAQGGELMKGRATFQHIKSITTKRKHSWLKIDSQAYLIWLGNVRKYYINHANKHSVLGWMPSILNNGDNIGSFLCHVHQISTTSVWKLNCINNTILQGSHPVKYTHTTIPLDINHDLISLALTGPTRSETCDTVVPEAAPRYKTLAPGFCKKKDKDIQSILTAQNPNGRQTSRCYS